ncbi:M56 family peptidase [Chitinophaga silvatica]|uniref:M56 family peptidase n=1 Tax=Chitinophaga silvatica TaxID=2282649 RepID=A0A3E1Y802_9BACT|nr:M56 family peptidase [Chitinophaga silvatica]
MLIYLLKANIALSLFFLAYRLGLRRLTFYTLNRLFLLGGILFSAVYPFIDVNAFINKHETLTGTVMVYIPDLSRFKASSEQFNAWMLLVYIFWIGVVVMGFKMAIQLYSLRRIHRQSKTGKLGETTVQILKEAINPFSFFHHIYINPTLHQPEELQSIIFHESVHVKQWHTLDVLIGEINNVFYWFNPGAWLMKSAIRENLEFITDRYLLQQGVDKVSYQYNLIKVSGIPTATAIANNFNFSHLKNRIFMMNSKRSSRYHLVRYLVLGSLAGGLVLLLNYSRASSITSYNFVPEPIKNSITLFTPAKDTATPAPTIKVTTTPQANKANDIVIKSVTISEVMPPLYLLDGKRISKEELDNVDPNRIKSVNVIKAEDQMKPYIKQFGDEAKGGIIDVVILKDGEARPELPKGTIAVTMRGVANDQTKVVVGGGSPETSLRNLVGKRLLLIDGQLATKEAIDYFDSHPEKIESVNVVKSENAVAIYGSAAKEGIVFLATKAANNTITVEGRAQMETKDTLRIKVKG